VAERPIARASSALASCTAGDEQEHVALIAVEPGEGGR
jgi:hypothetical protein